MPTITRTIKEDEVVLKTRISNGFDESGNRIRNRYSYKMSLKEFPTEEKQDKAFIDYLTSIGVEFGRARVRKNKVEKDQPKEKEIDKGSDVAVETKGLVSTRQIVKIPLDQLEMFELNPSNPPQEFIERLAKSIYEDGLNNPIRVVKSNDKYLIETGNKRYRAYRLLEEEYGEQYSDIECYVADYSMELNNENLDPVFTLKLMRDNVNTYERSIKDKILEVELYHRIFPDLKERGIASGRENEWIAEEMGIADASVKDYLKLIKVDDVRNKFLNDQIDYLQTGLRLVDYYNKYGKDDYYEMIGSIRENHQSGNDFQVKSYNVESHFWKKENEERQRKNQELQEQREKELKAQEENQVEEVQEEDKVPQYENVEELPHYYFQSKKIYDFNIGVTDNSCKLKFFIKNEYDKEIYYFDLYISAESIDFKVIKKLGKDNNYWYLPWGNNEKGVLFKLHQNGSESFEKNNSLKFLDNINDIFDEELIVLIIDDKNNFVKDLLKGVFVEK